MQDKPVDRREFLANPIVRLAVALGAVALVGAAAGWIILQKEIVRKALCKGHLNQIGLALSNYHELFGEFPPVNHARSLTKHSWRALIFPTDSTPYDTSHDWNSRINRQLLNKSSTSLWMCPSTSVLSGYTSYLAVEPACTPDQFVVVEVLRSDIAVFEPWDFDARSTRQLDLLWFDRPHGHGVNLLIVRSQSEFAHRPPYTVEALVTKDDLEARIRLLIAER